MAAITTAGETQEFAYTGGMQEFEVTIPGLYKLEVWGAQGGEYGWYDTKPGGLGGYTKGYARLGKGDKLYVCVGGKGKFASNAAYTVGGGYNGGAPAETGSNKSTGGGATHIGTFNSTLAAHGNTDGLFVVAGGGGGASGGPDGNSNPNGYGKDAGGSGGGINGANGAKCVYGYIAKGGGQAPIDANNLFGTAGTATAPYSGGGGGGLYGGQNGSQSGSGGGGSGYIGGVPAVTYRGREYAPETKNNVQSGNGKAAITLIGKSVPTVYLGSEEIVAIYIGSQEITDIKMGGN